MEWLSFARAERLFPVHRLDRETTGVILFARDMAAAERARVMFEGRELDKQYLFITDRPARAGLAQSYIERIGNEYVSREGSNARTVFEIVKTEGKYTLMRARPETGKPHQIRLHAQDFGMPLLGDVAHGGTDFPALCLHAHSIAIDGQTHISPPPTFFDDLKLLADRRLVRWLAACDRRERAQRSTTPQETLRYIHTEGDPLRLEKLGEVASLNWFRDTYPNHDEWSSIHRLLEIKGWREWYLQIRADRGKDPISDRSTASEPAPPERWLARENGLAFEFRRETGLSPGLFLDQRRNRAWLAQSAQGKRVLNLFCYTGGFSVAAAAAGAEQVVSVDVSKPFLEWTKRNFEINDLGLEPHEFRAIDSGEYLAWAAKKGLKFDIVICDPPSFARTNSKGKSTVFKIENEFEDLVAKCAAVGRTILFSTNFEQWSLDDLARKTQKALPNAKLLATPPADLDFELPRQPKNMKSLLIEV